MRSALIRITQKDSDYCIVKNFDGKEYGEKSNNSRQSVYHQLLKLHKVYTYCM